MHIPCTAGCPQRRWSCCHSSRRFSPFSTSLCSGRFCCCTSLYFSDWRWRSRYSTWSNTSTFVALFLMSRISTALSPSLPLSFSLSLPPFLSLCLSLTDSIDQNEHPILLVLNINTHRHLCLILRRYVPWSSGKKKYSADKAPKKSDKWANEWMKTVM